MDWFQKLDCGFKYCLEFITFPAINAPYGVQQHLNH